MNPTCDKPGCGLEMKDDYADDPGNPNGPAWVCPRTWEGDSHALCAKLAESEAKVKELEAKLAEADLCEENILAVLPEDFGAVEYIKELERQLEEAKAENREAAKTLRHEIPNDSFWGSEMRKVEFERDAALAESRKRGEEVVALREALQSCVGQYEAVGSNSPGIKKAVKCMIDALSNTSATAQQRIEAIRREAVEEALNLEKLARVLCATTGDDPDELEPGDALGIDGHNRKGEPCHFIWRERAQRAEAIRAAILNEKR